MKYIQQNNCCNSINAPFEIPALLALYVFYGVYILLHDWICYFSGMTSYDSTYLVALVLLALIVWCFHKHHTIKFALPEITRWDILVFCIFLFLFFIRVGRADNSYDTFNYHLFNQENPFRNFVTEDFFPGRRETFFPSLADRMYYPFRLLLGYRMGTILCTLLIMLCYLEVKRLVCYCLPAKLSRVGWKTALVSISCGMLLITNFVGYEICTYYVDLFPLPLMLYILSVVICGEESDQRGDPFLAICVGMIFAIKLSYGFLLLPLGFLFLWENRKRLKLRVFLLFLILGILPVTIYLFNAWRQTGNPVYPLFNTLFHSPYMTDQQNLRLNDSGVSSFLEGLLRPFCWAFFSSDNAFTSAYLSHSDGRLTLGFASALLLLLLPSKGLRAGRQVRILAILHIVMVYSVVFFIDAYPRLGLVIEPVGGALTLLLIVRCWIAATLRPIQRIMASVMAIAMVASAVYAGKLLLFSNYEWSWEYPFYMSQGAKTRKGYSLLFKDRNPSKEAINIVEGVEAWLSFTGACGGEMFMLKKNVPVLNVKYASADEYRRACLDAQLEKLGQKGLHTLVKWFTVSEAVQKMTDTGFRIVGKPQRISSYCSNPPVFIIPVEAGCFANEYFSLCDAAPVYTQELTEDASIHTLTGYVGLSSLIEDWEVDFSPITLRFSLTSGETTTVLAETTIAPDFEYHTLSLPCNMEAKAGDSLNVEAINSDGNPYGYFIDLINISFE